MKRTLIVIIATAACTMLVACSTTTVTLGEKDKKNVLTIKTDGTSPFFSAERLAKKAKNDFDIICNLVAGPSQHATSAEAKNLSDLKLDLAKVSGILKEGKSIINLFPVNSVEWSANCPPGVNSWRHI